MSYIRVPFNPQLPLPLSFIAFCPPLLSARLNQLVHATSEKVSPPNNLEPAPRSLISPLSPTTTLPTCMYDMREACIVCIDALTARRSRTRLDGWNAEEVLVCRMF